jgi:hypothetical protein
MSSLKTVVCLTAAVCVLSLSACSSKASTPTANPNTIYTQAAGTVQAELTKAAALTPSATATTAPTDTPQVTEAPTAAVSPTSAVILSPVPVATATKPMAADRGSLIAQTPADGTKMNPGQTFTVKWTIKNIGTTTWSTKYTLRYYAGDQMGGANSSFVKEVKPNDSIEVTANLTAPSAAGSYTGMWVLTNADGNNFSPITIPIVVGNAPAATNTTAAATAVPSATTAPTTAVAPTTAP